MARLKRVYGASSIFRSDTPKEFTGTEVGPRGVARGWEGSGRGGFSRPSRELAPRQADWFEVVSFTAAASRRLPGHDLVSLPAPSSQPSSNATTLRSKSDLPTRIVSLRFRRSLLSKLKLPSHRVIREQVSLFYFLYFFWIIERSPVTNLNLWSLQRENFVRAVLWKWNESVSSATGGTRVPEVLQGSPKLWWIVLAWRMGDRYEIRDPPRGEGVFRQRGNHVRLRPWGWVMFMAFRTILSIRAELVGLNDPIAPDMLTLYRRKQRSSLRRV